MEDDSGTLVYITDLENSGFGHFSVRWLADNKASRSAALLQ